MLVGVMLKRYFNMIAVNRWNELMVNQDIRTILIFKALFLLIRVTERQRERQTQRERQRSSVFWVTA